MTDRELATHLWITQFPGSISLCGPTHNKHCIESQLRLAAEVLRLMEYARFASPLECGHCGRGQDTPPLSLPPKDWSHESSA